jgi:hypothetical protein
MFLSGRRGSSAIVAVVLRWHPADELLVEDEALLPKSLEPNSGVQPRPFEASSGFNGKRRPATVAAVYRCQAPDPQCQCSKCSEQRRLSRKMVRRPG